MFRAAACVALVFAFPALAKQAPQTASAATAVQRDPQAVGALLQAISAMGGNVPSDSTATGTVTIVSGSETDQGAIRILTRGTNQTLTQVQTPAKSWSVIYSQGEASRTDGATATPLSLEAASTSQCAYFPLPYIVGTLQNGDIALQYIGTESLSGSSTQHLRTWNTFQSSPLYQFLTNFTVTDIWLDSSSGLMRRITFVQRDGGGATPKNLVTIDYSGYQAFGTVLYPAQIQESFNGTPWMTVSIQAASFNAGLTNADFAVVEWGN